MTEQHRHTDPVNCSVCDKVCPTRHRLNQHMRTAHAAKKHECTLCDKAFKCPKNLKVTFVRCYTFDSFTNSPAILCWYIRSTSQHTPVKIYTNANIAIKNSNRALTCIPIWKRLIWQNGLKRKRKSHRLTHRLQRKLKNKLRKLVINVK